MFVKEQILFINISLGRGHCPLLYLFVLLVLGLTYVHSYFLLEFPLILRLSQISRISCLLLTW